MQGLSATTQKDTETAIHHAYGFSNKILITASHEQVQLIWEIGTSAPWWNLMALNNSRNLKNEQGGDQMVFLPLSAHENDNILPKTLQSLRL